jgi:protein-tyrosine phosphatase
MINVIFVCLGNICRSPMAEGIFKKLVDEKGLTDKILCDSAGTSAYHVGELPDKRTCNVCLKNSIEINHLGRQFTMKDFNEFDYILAMDRENLKNIQKIETSSQKHKLFLMRAFDTLKDNDDVPDPYYGGIDGFEEVYNILCRSNNNFLDYLIREHKL